MMMRNRRTVKKSAQSAFSFEVKDLRWMAKQLVVLSSVLLFCASLATATPQAATKTSTTKATGSKSSSAKASTKTSAKKHGKRKPVKTSWKKKGQQGIQPERATEIQQALIREK